MGDIQIVSGKIVKGEGIGLKISFPTINVVVERNEKWKGVYACRVRIENASKGIGFADFVSKKTEFFGAGYVGEKSGLPKDKFICEVFLFEDPGNVYGKFAEIELLQKIRDVQKVKSLEELKVLIADDVEFAKRYMSGEKRIDN